MKTEFKIRIIQPIVPEYRVALFEGVGRRYPGRVELWAADWFNGQDSSQLVSSMKTDYTHSFMRFGPFQWQRGLNLRGLGRGDVLVACGDVHNFAMMLLALRAKMRGIRVVWWGHHWTASSKPLSVRIRLVVAKFLSDVYLCYTRTGIKYLESRGFQSGRVFATGNTINQEPIKKAIATWDGIDRFAGKKGLLCCSVLRGKVKLDLVIRALADKRLKDTVMAVIGEGPMKSEYERVAAECGVADRIVWLGATRDQEVMAPWFLSARAFVYPGSVGLSILHAMSYGLPVVVHGNANHQMPEYEVMEDGKTGVCFAEDDIGDLVCKIVMLLTDEPARMKMSKYCRDVAYNRYSMRQMIDNFATAIEKAGMSEEDRK